MDLLLVGTSIAQIFDYLLTTIVLLPWAQWDNKEDDEVVKEAYSRFMVKAKTLTKRSGHYYPFVYMNYADQEQDVYAGVGKENRKKLKKIQKKYDPEGIFDRLQPGYFKI